MEPVHMGPSMSLGTILLFILIYNRKHMRMMDLAAVLRYAVIVMLLGIDQPEATVSTVLPNRLRVVSLQTSSASPSFKSEQWGRQILGMPNPKEKSSFPKGNKEKSKEKSIVFFKDTEKKQSPQRRGRRNKQQWKWSTKENRVENQTRWHPQLGNPTARDRRGERKVQKGQP